MLSQVRRVATQFCIVLTIIILSWIAIEATARQIVRSIKWSANPYMLEYTDEIISQLYETDDPSYYREVIAEGWGRNINIDYTPFVEFMSRPSSGKHVTVVEQGFRSFPGGISSLDTESRRIFVFGGSTTFGMGVSGHETIPAYLQKHFADAGINDIHVFNFGVVSAYSTQERILFERLLNLGHVPDAVVFIDGLNDSISCDVPDTSSLSARLDTAINEGGGRTLAETYAKRSNVVKLIRYYTQGIDVNRNRPGANCTGADDQITAMVTRLDSNRRIIKGIADEFGISAVFVHQPVPYFAAETLERSLDPPEVRVNKKSIQEFYQRITARRDRGDAMNEHVLWLETMRSDGNMYIDDVHYSPRFHREMAWKIFENLRNRM